MKGKFVFTGALVSILFLSGCAQIPQASVDINEKVSLGIIALGDNGRKMVGAWEELSYTVLDEKWSEIYQKAEAEFRSERGLTEDDALSSQDREVVAGLATLVRDKKRKEIRNDADDKREVINVNEKNTLEANESVTELLTSANAVGVSRNSVIKSAGSLASKLR